MSHEISKYTGLPEPISNRVLSKYPDEWPLPLPSQNFMDSFLETQRKLAPKNIKELSKPLYLNGEAKRQVVDEAVRFGILSEPVEIAVKQVEKEHYWFTASTAKDNPLTGIDDFTIQYPAGLEVKVGDSHNWKDSCRLRMRVSANQKLDGQIVMFAYEAYENTELLFLALSSDLSSSHRGSIYTYDPKLTCEASSSNSFPNNRITYGEKLKLYLPKSIMPAEVLSDPAVDALLTDYLVGRGKLIFISSSSELRYWKNFLKVNGTNISSNLRAYLEACFEQE